MKRYSIDHVDADKTVKIDIERTIGSLIYNFKVYVNKLLVINQNVSFDYANEYLAKLKLIYCS